MFCILPTGPSPSACVCLLVRLYPMDVSLCFCSVCLCAWSCSHPPAPSVSVATPSASFTAYPTPSNLLLCFSLLCHIFIPWSLPHLVTPTLQPLHSFCSYLTISVTSHILSPVWVSRTERHSCLSCYAVGYWGRLLQLSTVRHGKGKHQQQQEKEVLFCASAPSWLLSFPLLHHTGWVGKQCSCKVQPPTRGFLYCFHTKSLCKRDFGCTCTDADQLNDNHEVCTWWLQNYNRKIS